MDAPNISCASSAVGGVFRKGESALSPLMVSVVRSRRSVDSSYVHGFLGPRIADSDVRSISDDRLEVREVPSVALYMTA